MSSRNRYDSCEYCFYCKIDLTGLDHQHDHFPVPQSIGGTDTVAACINCHDLKDRTPLDQWSATLYLTGVYQIVELAVWHTLGDREIPEEWAQFDRPARLVWAKLTRILLENPEFEMPSLAEYVMSAMEKNK